MKTVTLTSEQAKLVMQCLDLATKHGGLNAAAADSACGAVH
jgi:acyl-coenzyme A thioesterase PaaI-like protein